MSQPIRVVFFDAAETLFHVNGSVADIYLRHAVQFGYQPRPDSIRLISEAFGSGTAAVISPIGVIGIDGKDYTLPLAGERSIGSQLKAALEDIRYGRATDTEDWNFIVK